MHPLAVFDIDGVVADVRHRLRHLDQSPKNWNAFFAEAPADPLIPEGFDLAREYSQDHDLVWLTGRPQRLRRVTVNWLRAQGLRAATVHMRPPRDFRPAPILKRDVVAELARRFPIGIVVDDDPEVIAALEADGWPARLVTWFPRFEPLREAQGPEGRT